MAAELQKALIEYHPTSGPESRDCGDFAAPRGILHALLFGAAAWALIAVLCYLAL